MVKKKVAAVPDYKTIAGVGIDLDDTANDVTILIDHFAVPALLKLVNSYPVKADDRIFITIRRKGEWASEQR